MRTLKNPLFALLAIALSASCLASCSAPTAPEGFVLSVQLMAVNVAAIDELRVTIAPQTEMGTPHEFMMIPAATYDGITVSVESDGVLVMTIPGSVVFENAVFPASGDDPRLDIEMWSDDTSRRAAPQIRGTVTRAGEQIATGAAYFPEWPLPLGGSQTLTVPCRMGMTAACRP